jgi:galactoside O-acetyltransferase
MFDPGYHDAGALAAAGFAKLGRNVMISRTTTIIGRENIELGDSVRIDGYVTITAGNSGVKIGSYVHIGAYSYVGGGAGVEIGDFANLSQGVRLFSKSDDYTGLSLTNPTIPAEYSNVDSRPIMLGRHVIIGSSSIVLPGVSAGEGSAVGALSLVKTSLAPWMIYTGIPARMLRAREKRILELEKSFTSRQH